MSAVLERAVQNAFAFNYKAEPTIARFHRSNAFMRGIRGPYGSGKSVGCMADMVLKALQQEPDNQNRRRTRWGAVRGTYPELVSTTIQTCTDWLPLLKINWDAPITGTMVVPLQDGTTLDMTIFFVAAERPDHVKKLQSLDLTGGWANEAWQLDKSVIDALAARVGRFPLKKDGARITWCGIIMDTNSMEDDHWWHDLDLGPMDPEDAVKAKQMKEQLYEVMKSLGHERDLIAFFDQPEAVTEVNGAYFPNPKAENASNQPMGLAYWVQLCAGKTKEWIDVYLRNEYGKVIDGKAVYPEYNDEIHGKKYRLSPIPGIHITIGQDFGLSPAATLQQLSPGGQRLILGEVVARKGSMGLRQFLNDALKPYLANRFGSGYTYKMKGDRSGVSRAQGDDTVDCFNIARECGFEIEAAKTNNFIPRREAVVFYLNHLIEGRPAFLMDESCLVLRKGFRGGYHFRRVQVSGEARYTDEPHKNWYANVHDALQYGCLDDVAVESVGSKMNVTPAWKRRLSQGKDRPWRRRGAHG